MPKATPVAAAGQGPDSWRGAPRVYPQPTRRGITLPRGVIGVHASRLVEPNSEEGKSGGMGGVSGIVGTVGGVGVMSGGRILAFFVCA